MVVGVGTASRGRGDAHRFVLQAREPHVEDLERRLGLELGRLGRTAVEIDVRGGAVQERQHAAVVVRSRVSAHDEEDRHALEHERDEDAGVRLQRGDLEQHGAQEEAVLPQATHVQSSCGAGAGWG